MIEIKSDDAATDDGHDATQSSPCSEHWDAREPWQPNFKEKQNVFVVFGSFYVFPTLFVGVWLSRIRNTTGATQYRLNHCGRGKVPCVMVDGEGSEKRLLLPSRWNLGGNWPFHVFATYQMTMSILDFWNKVKVM